MLLLPTTTTTKNTTINTTSTTTNTTVNNYNNIIIKIVEHNDHLRVIKRGISENYYSGSTTHMDVHSLRLFFISGVKH